MFGAVLEETVCSNLRKMWLFKVLVLFPLFSPFQRKTRYVSRRKQPSRRDGRIQREQGTSKTVWDSDMSHL
ncbi:hypothetical protein Q5P01_001242 [Channa striata]|uniref:Uncharacterized protein n=1 Tax=Channa striata TaxID=64152 RepID=A0AA88T6X5_CHASR|nr:hypothetical protein Q5P01_001242 [Channa striata]